MRNVCVIEGCGEYVAVRGWCSMHYQRWRRTGDPLKRTVQRGVAPLDRMMTRIVHTPGPLATECWICTYSKDEKGYSRIDVGRRVVKAHRFTYEHFVGPIPDHLVPDHLCRVRACVNPEHLELVSQRENVLRGLSGQQIRTGRCRLGHSMDDAYERRNGRRDCLTCIRARYAAQPRKTTRRKGVRK